MKKASLRKSVNEFCKSCIYDPREKGTWRRQITDCTATTCPLYQVRPQLRIREDADNNDQQ